MTLTREVDSPRERNRNLLLYNLSRNESNFNGYLYLENIPGEGLRALIESCSIELTISRRMAAPSRVCGKRG